MVGEVVSLGRWIDFVLGGFLKWYMVDLVFTCWRWRC